MEIQVTAKPHMLLETVELMYAYVNEFPPAELTASGEYCLPAEAIQEMMDIACADISRSDPTVLRYFGKHCLPGESGKATCIARNIVYNIISVSKGSVSADCARILEERREQLKNRVQFSSIGEYRLDTDNFAEGQTLSLESALAGLNVDEVYRQMLLEVFSDFDDAVSGLRELVAPVAEKLEPLMETWVKRAEPLAEAWRDHFKRLGAVEGMLRHVNLQMEKDVKALLLQLRYLLPKGGHGMLDPADLSVDFHIGVAVPIEPEEAESFTPLEFEALRLLGNEGCMRMLRAMLDRPMSSRELARMLNIPLGTVCRNVSNLYDSRLLVIETVDGWKRYRTNMKAISLLCRHLMGLEKYKLF